MRKIIRSTYPAEFSIGLLLLIFAIACVLSFQLFKPPIHSFSQDKSIYLAMILVSAAPIIMILIVWEEILFPVKIKGVNGGIIFKNRIAKLRTQILIYCTIPIIFVFVYLKYEVNTIRFFIWAAVCIIPPIAEKIISGINNFNDYLYLTRETISYKNNKQEGAFKVIDIKNITLIKDDRDFTCKIQLILNDNKTVTIALDEMELEDYFVFIEKYILSRYKHLLT